MLRNRKGVTLLEIMTVVVMAAIMMAVALPQLKETRRASSMQSAKTQFESFAATARAIAVRTGSRTYLIRQAHSIRIEADSAGQMVTVVRKVNLSEVSSVHLGSTSGQSADTIMYDARGMATNLGATGTKFYFTAASGYGAGTKDSVCITRLGMVFDRSCGLVVSPEKTEEIEEKVEDPETGPTVEEPVTK
jgi:prepilin-type N-terminal cleavage/methylation domain-containing protein